MPITTVAAAVDLLIIRDIDVERAGNCYVVDGQLVTHTELLQLARQLDGGDRPLKYGNRKTVVDGIAFDSKAEAREYERLRVLEQSGVISELECQPRFELLPGFRDSEGKRHQPIFYVADFAFLEAGRIVVEDVKGAPETDVFRLKLKLLLFNYPHIDFRIVR